MTVGASKAATTITPQPALAPSPQPRPAPTARALPSKPDAQRGPFWMPIRGPNPTPIDKQSRIVNRMKAALVRLGIRGFNPKLKKAVERLDGLRTPEGEPIPPNTLAELRRDMARRRLVSDQ